MTTTEYLKLKCELATDTARFAAGSVESMGYEKVQESLKEKATELQMLRYLLQATDDTPGNMVPEIMAAEHDIGLARMHVFNQFAQEDSNQEAQGIK